MILLSLFQALSKKLSNSCNNENIKDFEAIEFSKEKPKADTKEQLENCTKIDSKRAIISLVNSESLEPYQTLR